MTTELCPVCNKPIDEHDGGLACCGHCGGEDVRFVRQQKRQKEIFCLGCGCIFTTNNILADDDETADAWNRRASYGVPTSKIPTEPGTYWVKLFKEASPTITEVSRGPNQKMFMSYAGTTYSIDTIRANHPEMQFYPRPIPTPEGER